MLKLTFKEIRVNEALKRLRKKGLPYHYDLNIYRGCSHNCVYCFARKSNLNLNSGKPSREICVYTNILESLERELRSGTWKGDIINLGGVSDCYQEAEKHFRIMPDLWRLLIKYKNPVIISTKSNLILRDMEWIDKLSRLACVIVAVSFSSCDDGISKLVEPGASLPLMRFTILKEFGKTSAHTGFHLFPILPFLADDKRSLGTFVRWASETDVSYMMSAFLYMTGAARINFLDFIDKCFFQHSEAYRLLYKKGGADKAYKTRIHSCLSRLRAAYGVNSNYRKFLPDLHVGQRSSF